MPELIQKNLTSEQPNVTSSRPASSWGSIFKPKPYRSSWGAVGDVLFGFLPMFLVEIPAFWDYLFWGDLGGLGYIYFGIPLVMSILSVIYFIYAVTTKRIFWLSLGATVGGILPAILTK